MRFMTTLSMLATHAGLAAGGGRSRKGGRQYLQHAISLEFTVASLLLTDTDNWASRKKQIPS